MRTWHMFSFGAVCLLVAPMPLWAQKSSPPSSSAATPAAASGLSIAVADFSGQDKELGRFLADTLLTDLAQSERLHMVERAEIGKALTELKLQSTGLAEPQDVKKVGKLLGADRLIVGSYLVRDNQLLVNARLLDVRTGRVTPGGAANVGGNRDEVMRLMQQLANQFHKRVTGAYLPHDNEPRREEAIPNSLPDPAPEKAIPDPENTDTVRSPARDRSDSNNRDSNRSDSDGYNVRQPDDPASSNTSSSNPDSSGSKTYTDPNTGASRRVYVPTPSRSASAPLPFFTPPFISPPAYSSPSRVVRQGELRRVLGGGSREASRFFTPGGASAPLNRLRALAALVASSVPVASRAAANPTALASVLPDARLVPAWANSYVLTAIRHGIWPTSHALHPLEPANWGFVGSLVNRNNLLARAGRNRSQGNAVAGTVAHARQAVGSSVIPAQLTIRNEPSHITPAVIAPSEIVYTGLLVEARDLPVLRSMSARIVDTDGNQIYPDVRHVPDIDWVEDHGMADYYHADAERTRTGAHPMIVSAIDISNDAIVVSVETGRHILEAERHDGFLRLWHVGILLDQGR